MTFVILSVLFYLAGWSTAARFSLWQDDQPIDYTPTTGDEWDGGLR